MAADVRLRWVLDVVDRGAGKKLLVQDRQIRRSLEQTDRVQKRVAASGVGAANRQVASSRRVATARQTESTAAAGAAGSVENYTRAQAHALGLGARIVAQTQRTTAGYNRQAAAAERLTVAERARAAASRTAAGAGAVSAGALGVGAAGAAALGRRARGVALGGGLGLGVALAQTVQFDRAMRNVNSIAQLSERQFGRLSKEVRGLAGPTAQAPRVLAEGLYTLVSSGFDARESMFILGKSARAATAGLTTTEVSTAAVAAVLNSYQLPASRAGLVSDQLFRTVDRGVISFEQLAENVGDVLPFASSLGIGLDQVGASIATLTKAGISAPETMTRIKAVMASLLKPGKDLKTTITELGFESGEALIKQKGFQGALEALARTTGGSKEELAKLFPNIRALGGALALTGRNSRGARKDLEGMRDASGATNRALAQQSKSISFQWNRLKAGASSLAIRIGSKLVPAVSSLVGAMGDLVSGRGDVAGVFKDLAAGVRGRPDTGERGSAPIRRLEVRGAGQQGRAVAVGPRHDVGITAGVRAPEASKAFDIGAKIRDVIGDITDAGRKLIPIVTDAGRQLVDAFKPAQPFLQNILLPLLVGLGKGLLATVVTAFKIAVPVIKVFAIALGAIGKVAAPLRPVLEGVGFALSLLLGGVIVKGIGLVAKFVGNFKIVKVVLAVVLGPLRLLGTAFGSLFRIIGRLPATLGKVGAALSRAGALFGKLPGLLGRVAGGVLNAAGRLATAAGRGLARLPAKLGVTAYRAGRAVVDKLGSWGGKVAGVGSRLLGRIVGGARSVLGDLTGWFGRLGSKVVSAIVGGIKSAGGAVKDAIVGLIPGPLRGALKHIPGIGGFFGRRGGRVQRARRFQRGGLVDAFVSPGEVVVHGASSWMVPGRPTAADSVYAQLPDSAAVLTGDGQRRMMGGASLGSALARQAPHFQRGGIVPGRYTATAYGPPWGGKQGTGTTKTGVDLRKAPKLYGVAVDPRNIPLGKNIYAWPNPFGYGGKFSAFDTGGAIKGRRIDFYDWRGRAEQNAWGRRIRAGLAEPDPGG